MKNFFLIIMLYALLVQVQFVKAKSKPQQPWEFYVIDGNEEREVGNYSKAKKNYLEAVRLLEEKHIQDLGLAVVYKDLSVVCREEQDFSQARFFENQASNIYKQEIEDQELGAEYGIPDSGPIGQLTSRPDCPLCHENKRVVPIYYGTSTGYKGQVPQEKDVRFTHKPGGQEIQEERWYCKVCKQMF